MDTGNELINTICSGCQIAMTDDEKWLHEAVLDIYNFVYAFREEKHFNEVSIFDTVRSPNTMFRLALEEPGNPRKSLPETKRIKLVDPDGEGGFRASLKNTERELFRQCLLSLHHCHHIVIFLPELLEEIFLDDEDSPVEMIEVIYYEPKHKDVATHYTYCFTMKGGKEYAVNFTDRQLGWLEIVRDWKAYRQERVARFLNVNEDIRERGEQAANQQVWLEAQNSKSPDMDERHEFWWASQANGIVIAYRYWQMHGKIE